MASITFALAFTFAACGGDDNGNNGGNVSSKNSCISAELAVKANTLDNVAAACDASRGEVLSQLPDKVGSCNKNDLDFDKTIKDIATSCGVSEITIASSSSRNNSGSSSSRNSSSSNGGTSSPSGNSCGKLMSTNLNVDAPRSVCYDNDPANCAKYGRLYDWAAAMALPDKCNTTSSEDDADCAIQDKHRGICPSGQHIPSNDELEQYGTYECLKNQAGGGGHSGGDFYGVGDGGGWWSSSETGSDDAYYRIMYYYYEYVDYLGYLKSNLYSVRCLQD